jgi:hypothetical protein
MKKDRKELEAKLEKESKAIIQELLEWEEKHQEPDLTQIEDIVLELRERFGKEMVESMIESQENKHPVEIICPNCGYVMQYKGQKRKVVESRVGEVDLDRGSFYCPKCKTGIFPPGSAIEVE